MTCACVADHNPNPIRLHVHHILPRSWGGADDDANLITLCPTTHANVHALLNLYIKAGGKPAWEQRGQFGPAARDLAARAWDGWERLHPGEKRPPWTLGTPFVLESECAVLDSATEIASAP